MLKKLLLLLCFVYSTNAQDSLRYSIDLNRLKNDRLTVEVQLPAGAKEYCFPKIVPGTYAIYDFGRYVSNLQAFDAAGKAVKLYRKDFNTFQIAKAKRLRYEVDDTWDSPEIEGKYIFEPAGTNFQEDTLFALNTHAILGYVKGAEKMPVSLQLIVPSDMLASSAIVSNNGYYVADSYQNLTDAPILVAHPDTAMLKVGDADILISVFSPNQVIRAAQIAEKILPLLKSQQAYLGGTFPVKNYAFLVVMSTHLKNGSYGALEHSKSSFYYLPEYNISTMASTIRDVSAHEFFHIQTPLNFHSEEIGNFDFQKPKMSRHLWLYEGLTEYAAHHTQLQGGLTTLEQFMESMTEKVNRANDDYNPSLAFTKLSLGALDKYKDEYGNVYQKGALIGFCLDLLLRKETNGAYGTQRMMRELAAKYGPKKSFKDEELFDMIEKTSKVPAVKEFFLRYVSKGDKLPLKELASLIGLEFGESIPGNSTITYGYRNSFEFRALKNPSPSQLKMRQAWLHF
jgi:predicted metalloprotease with PDZ domain